MAPEEVEKAVVVKVMAQLFEKLETLHKVFAGPLEISLRRSFDLLLLMCGVNAAVSAAEPAPGVTLCRLESSTATSSRTTF